MYTFYTLQNNIKPHCVKCHAVEEGDSKVCIKMYGKGKERKRCGGKIEADLFLDWSINFLKDYSLTKHDDLSLFDACWGEIQEKMDEAKGNKAKVHVQREIERFMRVENVDLINKIDGTGEMVTTSRYRVPAGESKVSEFGYEDLRGRFEITVNDPNHPDKEEGFMKFTPITEESKKAASKSDAPEDLKCYEKVDGKVCGFEAKAKIGLLAHQRSHKTTGK